jgi:RNA:NAD 2'-phosphotransferase (TPT1/KptA family)
MTFFHGTSKENWKTIQEEGVLWGRRYIVDNEGRPVKEVSRCTYLALERKVAE